MLIAPAAVRFAATPNPVSAPRRTPLPSAPDASRPTSHMSEARSIPLLSTPGGAQARSRAMSAGSACAGTSLMLL